MVAEGKKGRYEGNKGEQKKRKRRTMNRGRVIGRLKKEEGNSMKFNNFEEACISSFKLVTFNVK